jgi:two-component system chemotaxis sensor kinase CheA
MEENELIQAFISESLEMLDDAEPKIVALQGSEGSDIPLETINAIFRLFHSIKGSAGFLHFTQITSVTHEAETFLDMLRKGKTMLKAGDVDTLCRASDLLRKLVEELAQTGIDSGYEEEAKDVVELLKEACSKSNNPHHDSNLNKNSSGAPERKKVMSSDEEAKNKSAGEMTDAEKADMLIADEPMAGAAAPEKVDAVAIAEKVPQELKAVITPEMATLFVQEADEVLENAEQALIQVEADPSNTDAIHNAFRNIHTFKGNCGLLELKDLQRLSHKAETVLDGMRNGMVKPEKDIIKILLTIVDIFKKTVVEVGQGGTGEITGFLGLSDMLEEIISAHSLAQEKEKAPHEDKITSQQPEQKTVALQEQFQKEAVQASELKHGEPAIPKEKSGANVSQEKQADFKKEIPSQAGTGSVASSSVAMLKRDIRVNVDKLEHLNDLIGELVIAEAMVTHNEDVLKMRSQSFERTAHQLTLITNELQDLSMSLRMIPVEATFKKMVRLVHDLSAKFGKKVNLQLFGIETEIDRNVAELISDPLVHMVRNSVDHGIEKPEKRKTAGKPETGSLIIEAKHQAGEVLIIVTDDGHGLDRDKIMKKGIERGLIKQGSSLKDEEIYQLIFEPGFSTADKITDVSGRGVGMDVVKKNIEKVRGRVDIKTEKGKGSSFIMHIPLTLAIIQGMLVKLGVNRFIIPLLSIRESLRPTPDMIKTVVGKGELISIRGELLPLFRLAKLFNIPDAITDPTHGIVVVVEAGFKSAALVADDLLGQQQTVVKSLGEAFGHMPGITGASILSDGRVGLILDIAGIVRLATGQCSD